MEIKKKETLVSPLVPFRTKWFQTDFSVLNFGKQSVNISLLCNNCLSDCLISNQSLPYATIQICSLSFTQKSFERTYGYWLPKFESACSWELKSFFFLIGNVAYDKTALVIILSQLVYKGKSQLKEH